jgi:hypothetical protein
MTRNELTAIGGGMGRIPDGKELYEEFVSPKENIKLNGNAREL